MSAERQLTSKKTNEYYFMTSMTLRCLLPRATAVSRGKPIMASVAVLGVAMRGAYFMIFSTQGHSLIIVSMVCVHPIFWRMHMKRMSS